MLRSPASGAAWSRCRFAGGPRRRPTCREFKEFCPGQLDPKSLRRAGAAAGPEVRARTHQTLVRMTWTRMMLGVSAGHGHGHGASPAQSLSAGHIVGRRWRRWRWSWSLLPLPRPSPGLATGSPTAGPRPGPVSAATDDAVRRRTCV